MLELLLIGPGALAFLVVVYGAAELMPPFPTASKRQEVTRPVTPDAEK